MTLWLAAVATTTCLAVLVRIIWMAAQARLTRQHIGMPAPA